MVQLEAVLWEGGLELTGHESSGLALSASMLQRLDPALPLSGQGQSTHFACQGLVTENKHRGSLF